MPRFALLVSLVLLVLLLNFFPMDWQLEYIASRGDIRMLKWYLMLGVNPDGRLSSGRTMLHYSGVAGHLDFCRELLECGASVELRDGKFGGTPLSDTVLAVLQINYSETQNLRTILNRIECCRLMQRFAKSSPINQAIASNNLETLRTLIAQGADLNSQDEHGLLPLATALLNQNFAACELLLASGADPCISDLDESGTEARLTSVVLTPVSSAVLTYDTKTLEFILALGACIDDYGPGRPMSAAMVAERIVNVDAYEYLVSHGATYHSEIMDVLVGRARNH